MQSRNQKKYLEAASHTLAWLEKNLDDSGKISVMPYDLACYYKVPTFLMQHGRGNKANRVLDFIQRTFMQTNGDFLSTNEYKSELTLFNEFWGYTNGWIAQAAQRLGRFDISYPAWKYLQNYNNPDLGGWKTHQIPSSKNSVDVLSTAHLGLACLYFSDIDKAIKAGELLAHIFSKQQQGSSRLYLRVTPNGKLIDEELGLFGHVNQKESDQAYFMIGYPIAFLTKLYQTTQDLQHLETAELYFNWAYECSENLKSSFSHKLAWGASCFAEVTSDPRASELSQAIADYLVSTQEDDGTWLSGEDAVVMCDQTMQNAICLTEVAYVRSQH